MANQLYKMASLFAPYGSWKSPITAELVGGGEIGSEQLRINGGDIYWIERQAREGGRKGIGRHAVEILISQLWPTTKRLTVEVVTQNQSAIAFWRAMGYRDYSLALEIMPRG